VVGGAATLPLQINPIEVVDTPARITVQQSPPVSVYVGQSVRARIQCTRSLSPCVLLLLPLLPP
jgi:hypothetical protein